MATMANVTMATALKKAGLRVTVSDAKDISGKDIWKTWSLDTHFKQHKLTPYHLRCRWLEDDTLLFELYKTNRKVCIIRREAPPYDKLHYSLDKLLMYLDSIREQFIERLHFGVVYNIEVESLAFVLAKNWRVLEEVPREYLSQELIRKTVEQDGYAIFGIPEPARTEEVWLIAASNAEVEYWGDQYVHPCLSERLGLINQSFALKVFKKAIESEPIDMPRALKSSTRYVDVVQALL